MKKKKAKAPKAKQPAAKPRRATRSIRVDYLARVEGEGALYVQVKGKQVADVKLKIFEPPRFFEALLRGRDFTEAPDITARICGICPVAYQMSSVTAMEDACGVLVSGSLKRLRRLLYCGEWIESHTLHIYMLHAPDFLGYESAIAMAKDHPDWVKRGLQLKKVGNEIMNLLGGREIHPINVRVGGFYRAPSASAIQALLPRLEWAREAAKETLRWAADFPYPDFERDYEFVSLKNLGEYPIYEGRVVSNRGLDIAVQDYEENFFEEQVPHSNALHSFRKGAGAYFVGPMARYNLNYAELYPEIQEAASQAGLGPTCLNPFQSILVRSVEVLQCCEEAIRIARDYHEPPAAAVPIEPKPGTGFGATEAPRGLLYHRYRLGVDGKIEDAKIVPPTSQNQKTIEDDLYRMIPAMLRLSDDKLRQRCEQAIRNYDPCISCATHFLKLTMDRQ